MNPAEKEQKLRKYLKKISPSLEGIANRRRTAMESPGALESMPPDWEKQQLVNDTLERVNSGGKLEPRHMSALEAIILPDERPVVDIIGGDFQQPADPFAHLFSDATLHQNIKIAIPSVGRIELPNQTQIPFAGTGFVVGNNLLMTNRHVAELFCNGLGTIDLSFRTGQTAQVNFKRENVQNEDSTPFKILKLLMIHPYWDMALFRTDGLGLISPLTLSTMPVANLTGREIVVMGYPAMDYRNDAALQNKIFRGTFNVKRLQPGKLNGTGQVDSFGNSVNALLHDASTLGGNSDSVVLDTMSGRAVGLHFAGVYLESNYAVPLRLLAEDHRVVDTGINFDSNVTAPTVPWDNVWSSIGEAVSAAAPVPAGPASSVPAAAAPSPAQAGETRLVVPLEITVRLGAPAAASALGAPAVSLNNILQPMPAPPAAMEAFVNPYHDQDYSTRKGYNPDFLDVHIPMPTVSDASIVAKTDDGGHELRYEHFSIVMNKKRRLALFTASNVDARPKKKKPETGRDYTRKGLTGLGPNDMEKWFTDPRIPEQNQLPDVFFNKDRGAFDKGHIVRREDPAWGDTFDEVRRANGDTYHSTNCSPQVADFNRSQSHGEWGQLENYILTQAKTEQLSLFAGPLLADDDVDFNGVDASGKISIKIPKRFWKVVMASSNGQLQTFAFLLEQDLSKMPAEAPGALEFAVNAQWRRRMVSIQDLQDLIGAITFPKIVHDSDQIDRNTRESLETVLAAAPAASATTSAKCLVQEDFDLDKAVFLAEASQAAYGDATAAKAWTQLKGFNTFGFFDRADVQGFWCTVNDIALLSFRGTSNTLQWLRDARFFPASHPWGLVHIGFRDGVAAVEPDLAAFDEAAKAAKHFWITGHSLGGALAVIAAARFKMKGVTPSLYTYGQPRVGFANFADRFGMELPGRMYRFVNQADIVPRVPPGLLYQHCGIAKRIVRPGVLEAVGTSFPESTLIDNELPPLSETEFAQLQISLGAAPGLPATETMALEGSLPFISDHAISEYIRLLTDIRDSSK